jgi:F420-dependent oxidoreductase-like protein
MNIGGDVLGTPLPPTEIVEHAVEAEDEGFPSAWMTHFSRGVDALSVLSVAGTRTRQIELGVGVVPTYPRHPFALAQQAATTQAFCGGRLTLGVGVSHRPVIEQLHGLSYDSPAQHMREYLSVLVPLVNDGEVDFHGEFYNVSGGFVVPGTSSTSVVVAGLSRLMVQVAGECADGTVTWLAGPRTLDGIVPALREAAAAAGRPAPRAIAAIPVAVHDDREAAIEKAEVVFARYGTLENYQRQLEREGVPTPGAMAVVGSEPDVEKQLRRFAEAGATELWPIVIPVDEDSVRRTRTLLAQLAPEL